MSIDVVAVVGGGVWHIPDRWGDLTLCGRDIGGNARHETTEDEEHPRVCGRCRQINGTPRS